MPAKYTDAQASKPSIFLVFLLFSLLATYLAGVFSLVSLLALGNFYFMGLLTGDLLLFIGLCMPPFLLCLFALAMLVGGFGAVRMGFSSSTLNAACAAVMMAPAVLAFLAFAGVLLFGVNVFPITVLAGAVPLSVVVPYLMPLVVTALCLFAVLVVAQAVVRRRQAKAEMNVSSDAVQPQFQGKSDLAIQQILDQMAADQSYQPFASDMAQKSAAVVLYNAIQADHTPGRLNSCKAMFLHYFKKLRNPGRDAQSAVRTCLYKLRGSAARWTKSDAKAFLHFMHTTLEAADVACRSSLENSTNKAADPQFIPAWFVKHEAAFPDDYPQSKVGSQDFAANSANASSEGLFAPQARKQPAYADEHARHDGLVQLKNAITNKGTGVSKSHLDASKAAFRNHWQRLSVPDQVAVDKALAFLAHADSELWQPNDVNEFLACMLAEASGSEVAPKVSTAITNWRQAHPHRCAPSSASEPKNDSV